jgi:hypothetical protein
MNEREKIQKAFNQCSDALINLDNKSILKVFQLLSVHFDVLTFQNNYENPTVTQKESTQMFLPSVDATDNKIIITETIKKSPKNPIAAKSRNGSSKNNLQFLTDFDFRPSNKESLKDFANKYNAKSNFEFNLVFTYYLQEILNIQEITTDHIYSCYRHMALKLPSFPQTLTDTKKHKGWIETADMNNLRVTRVGINHIEHDFNKKNG